MRSVKFRTTPKTDNPTSNQSLPTFLDHLHELRRRLFWVVATILLAASASYSFLDQIFHALLLPLGSQKLIYLTPGGGLSFSFKLCAYAGVLAAVPVIMYHAYKFLEPLMGQKRRSAVFYVGLSSLLAVTGVCFAYYVSLPGALRFLTGFNMEHIQAMLTADSYLSFVLTYLLGAAILFQIPLLMLIINTMTPLKPSKLMKLLRYVIVAAFIIGAVISPTPDMMNQALFALPIIGMYLLGVTLVWMQNMMKARRSRKTAPEVQSIPKVVVSPQPQIQVSKPAQQLVQAVPKPVILQRSRPAPVKAISDVAIVPPTSKKSSQLAQRPSMHVRSVTRRPNALPRQPATRPAPRLAVPPRSVDGFINYRGASTVRST